MAIFDGFDAGKTDSSSWVRVTLDKSRKIIIVKIIENLKIFVKENFQELINRKLVEFINYENAAIEDLLKNNYITSDFFKNHNSIVLTDNDFVAEALSQLFSINNKKNKSQNDKQTWCLERKIWHYQ